MINQNCKDEIRECCKHEIIMKIANIIGDCPSNICIAEEIFESIK